MNPVTGLSLGRIAIGALSLARPDLASQALALDATANPQVPYAVRLFGSREIALGAITLLSSGKARRNAVLLGIGVDGADVMTGLLGPREGQVGRRTGMAMVGVAAGAVLAGISGLRVKRKAILTAR